jgi:predicted P-loop ATPase
LVYEISELESFSRAEASAVKAFVSSTEDNFRAPYERQNEKHKRQTVFAATTNAVEYLKDWTGNTRFWPLECGRIDLDGLAAVREQLLAEALVLYRQGAPTYPTLEQQRELFKPEQDRRMMTHPWQDMIIEALESNPDRKQRPEVSVRDLMHNVLKIDLARINPQGAESQRVGQILHALGWSKHRKSEGTRPWVWVRPAPVEAQSEPDESIPF